MEIYGTMQAPEYSADELYNMALREFTDKFGPFSRTDPNLPKPEDFKSYVRDNYPSDYERLFRAA